MRAGVLAQKLVDLDADQEDDRGCVEVRGEGEEDTHGAARGLEVREAAGDLTPYGAQMRCSVGAEPVR